MRKQERQHAIDFNTELGPRYEACQLTVNNDIHSFATDMHQSDRPVTGVLAFILINPLTQSIGQNCVNGDLSLAINIHNRACLFDVKSRNLYVTLCVVSHYRAFSVVLTCKDDS